MQKAQVGDVPLYLMFSGRPYYQMEEAEDWPQCIPWIHLPFLASLIGHRRGNRCRVQWSLRVASAFLSDWSDSGESETVHCTSPFVDFTRPPAPSISPYFYESLQTSFHLSVHVRIG